MQLDWGARASSLAVFGVSPKAFGNARHAPKGGLLSCSGQSAGRRLEATGTVALPFFNCMAAAEADRPA
jgi:hypothetical protein